MSKLRECSHCGEFTGKAEGDRTLCPVCSRSMVNHMLARLRFFGDTQRMISRLTGEDIFEPIELPFATKAK